MKRQSDLWEDKPLDPKLSKELDGLLDPMIELMEGEQMESLKRYWDLMFNELISNSNKGHWANLDIQYLISEVFYHVAKLHKAYQDQDDDKILEYAANCGNLCMMITDKRYYDKKRT